MVHFIPISAATVHGPRRMPSSVRSALLAASLLATLTAQAQPAAKAARPDPLDPKASVPALSYESSFFRYRLTDPDGREFVGLQNYERLLTNPLFWQAMKNTVWFSVLGVPLAIGASLAAAVILNARTIKWRPVWRVTFFAPYVTTLVATAVLWNYLLHTRYGVINWALTSVGLPAVDWLGNPDTSIPAILIFVVWKIFGYNMLIFLAVLQTVPDDLYEAARIDGAGPWQSFYKVIFPLATPALVITALFSFMSAWNEYVVAAVVLQDTELFTLPVGLKLFQSSLATQWGLYAAGSLLVSIPVVALFLVLSRYLISGLTLGAVKG